MNSKKTTLQILINIIILIGCIHVLTQVEDVLLREFSKGLALISIVLMLRILSKESLTLNK